MVSVKTIAFVAVLCCVCSCSLTQKKPAINDVTDRKEQRRGDNREEQEKEARRGNVESQDVKPQSPDLVLEKYGILVFWGDSPCTYTAQALEEEIVRVFKILEVEPYHVNWPFYFQKDRIPFGPIFVAGLTTPTKSLVWVKLNESDECLRVSPPGGRNAFGHELGHVIIEQKKLFCTNGECSGDGGHTNKKWWDEID